MILKISDYQLKVKLQKCTTRASIQILYLKAIITLLYEWKKKSLESVKNVNKIFNCLQMKAFFSKLLFACGV